jgi:hypothetical protein
VSLCSASSMKSIILSFLTFKKIILSFRFLWNLFHIIIQNYMLLSLIPLFTMVSCSYFHEQLFGTSILKWIRAFFWSESHFAQCVTFYNTSNHMFQRVVVAIVSAISVAKLHFGAWPCTYFFLIIAIKIFQ